MSLFALLIACHDPLPTQVVPIGARADVDLDTAGPVRHEAVVSARWTVPTSGIIDLTNPAAARLADDPHPIVLPVHVLVHPTAGTFVVDTGVSRAPSPAGAVLKLFAGDIEPVTPLADILAGHPPLAGVLLTHGHVDHILGLPDVPAGVPVYAGPGEQDARGAMGQLTHGTFRRALGDHTLSLWDFEHAGPLGPIPHAVDVLGDGSIWALSVPGHTPGSTAYLARTVDGPVLFTGDCSHTRWGWDHDVAPGTYTEDHDHNVESLGGLRTLAAAHPSMSVFVGHEL